MLDTDIATLGYQGGSSLSGIGGGQKIAIAVYAKNVGDLQGAIVDVTWEATKASFPPRGNDTDTSIPDDEDDINGAADVVFAEEANILGSVSSAPGYPVSEDGHFVDKFVKLGSAAAENEYVLIYFVVLETEDAFTTDDYVVVSVKATAVDSNGILHYMGVRNLYVNSGGGLGVKKTTWGEVKSQFKD